ncbi:MAG: polymer-forming cytoskeletal protein [Gammaproteobacteria bacterium]|nr:polymer-forming cytoskeletal protein [Gammaproteobacteria bacterium]
MFGRNKKVNSTRIETLVGKNTCVTGNLSFTGGLHVEGEIDGNVHAGDDSSVLILSEDGIIKGDIHVPNMVLNGTVEGDVYASDHVELAPRARINGNVYYHLIEMSMGSTLNGSLIHQEGGKPKLEYKGPGQEDEEVAKSESKPKGSGSDEGSDSSAKGANKTMAAAGNS